MKRMAKPPVISACNGVQLTKAVEEHGLRPRDVFFKAYFDARRKYGRYGALPYAHFDDGEDLEEQFMHLTELHRAMPAKIIRPIALVEGTDLVGYLSRRAAGQSLEDIWKQVWSTDKKAALRCAALFRRAAFDVINTLNELNSHLLWHGDADKRNIKVSSSGSIKLFDPRYNIAIEDSWIVRRLYDDIAELVVPRG